MNATLSFIDGAPKEEYKTSKTKTKIIIGNMLSFWHVLIIYNITNQSKVYFPLKFLYDYKSACVYTIITQSKHMYHILNDRVLLMDFMSQCQKQSKWVFNLSWKTYRLCHNLEGLVQFKTHSIPSTIS